MDGAFEDLEDLYEGWSCLQSAVTSINIDQGYWQWS